MSLTKLMQINSSLSAEFHTVKSFNYDEDSKALTVCVGSYIDESSDKPVHYHHLQLNNVEPMALDKTVIEGLLKQDPTVLPVLVSEEEPEVTENDEETGEIIVVTPKVEAVYQSFFADAVSDAI